MIYVKWKNVVRVALALLVVIAIFALKLDRDTSHHHLLTADLHKLPRKNVSRAVLTNQPPQTALSLSQGTTPKSYQDPGVPHKTHRSTERHSETYIKFRGMDIPMAGDFPCANSLARDSCLIQRRKLSDFEVICDRIGPYCKGFVLKISDNNQQLLAYFKRKLGAFKPNKKTHLFVKREFLEKARFKSY